MSRWRHKSPPVCLRDMAHNPVLIFITQKESPVHVPEFGLIPNLTSVQIITARRVSFVFSIAAALHFH